MGCEPFGLPYVCRISTVLAKYSNVKVACLLCSQLFQSLQQTRYFVFDFFHAALNGVFELRRPLPTVLLLLQ